MKKTTLALLFTAFCAQAQFGIGSWFTAASANQGDVVTLIAWVGNGDDYGDQLRVVAITNQHCGNIMSNPACIVNVNTASTNYYPHGSTNYLLDVGDSLYITNAFAATNAGTLVSDTYYVMEHDCFGLWMPFIGNWPSQIQISPAHRLALILEHSSDLTNWEPVLTNAVLAIGTNNNYRLRLK